MRPASPSSPTLILIRTVSNALISQIFYLFFFKSLCKILITPACVYLLTLICTNVLIACLANRQMDTIINYA